MPLISYNCDSSWLYNQCLKNSLTDIHNNFECLIKFHSLKVKCKQANDFSYHCYELTVTVIVKFFVISFLSISFIPFRSSSFSPTFQTLEFLPLYDKRLSFSRKILSPDVKGCIPFPEQQEHYRSCDATRTVIFEINGRTLETRCRQGMVRMNIFRSLFAGDFILSPSTLLPVFYGVIRCLKPHMITRDILFCGLISSLLLSLLFPCVCCGF